MIGRMIFSFFFNSVYTYMNKVVPYITQLNKSKRNKKEGKGLNIIQCPSYI